VQDPSSRMLSATASKTVLNLSSLSPIKRVEIGRVWSEGLSRRYYSPSQPTLPSE